MLKTITQGDTMMTERDQFHPDEPETIEVKIRVGGEIRTFTPRDTMIRRFVQGDGEFDHCVYRDPEGRFFGFTPYPEAMEALVQAGFPIHVDETIDDNTITHYSKVQASQIDDHPSSPLQA